jgi:uncharacterized protein
MEGDFEWDPRKRERCFAERGIDFLDAIRVFDSAYIELSAASTTERRIRTVGVAEGRTLTVVWTLRNGMRRIITVWPASRKERRLYHEFIEDSKNRSHLP